jgi:hypothetical protein
MEAEEAVRDWLLQSTLDGSFQVGPMQTLLGDVIYREPICKWEDAFAIGMEIAHAKDLDSAFIEYLERP